MSGKYHVSKRKLSRWVKLDTDDGTVGMCQSTLFLIGNITFKQHRQFIGNKIYNRMLYNFVFGVYNSLSQVCQLSVN